MSIDRTFVAGLRDAGWKGPVKIYDWTENDPGIDALHARARNDREAQKVADLIVERLKEDPKARITLTSHSGGTGIAVWALEKLPKGVQVHTLVLLASALSPGYDLTAALKHVRGRAYSYYSENDTLVLGAGTELFGTIDGKRSVSAGLVGFKKPDGADTAQYEKLDQRPWTRQWMIFDNAGSHIGCMSRTFVTRVVAPTLIAALTGKPEPEAPTTRP
jgi:pimeloyl-ACP methyl ester carboxylesterase